jgi:GNAT superfamily N-acetyltransferase
MKIQSANLLNPETLERLSNLFSFNYLYPGETGNIGNIRKTALREDTCDLENAIHTWVAFEDSQIVGFIYTKKGELATNATELSRIVVYPKYRRRGVAQALVSTAEIHHINNQTSDYICAQNVTIHDKSQRLMDKYVATSINPSRYSWTDMGVDITETPFSLIYVVNDFKRTIAKSRQEVYVPKKHQEFLDGIYTQLETEREFRTTTLKLSKERQDEVLEHLERNRGYHMITLPLDKERSFSYIEFFEQQGFAFCGIIPQAQRIGQNSGKTRYTDHAVMVDATTTINPQAIKVLPKYELLKTTVLKNYHLAQL